MTRKLTEHEFERVTQVIENTEWVHEQVNRELLAGKGWDDVMYDVAVAFGIVDAK